MGYLTGVHTENAVQGVQKVLFDQLNNSKYEGLGTPSDHPLWSRRPANTYISAILPLVTPTPPTHCTHRVRLTLRSPTDPHHTTEAPFACFIPPYIYARPRARLTRVRTPSSSSRPCAVRLVPLLDTETPGIALSSASSGAISHLSVSLVVIIRPP